jgi:hypothetical protein
VSQCPKFPPNTIAGFAGFLGSVIRSVEVDSPVWTYAAAGQIADFSALRASLTVRAAQISSTYGLGAGAESTIWL